MDAPPNGPEEGLLFPSDANPDDKRALLVASVELLGAAGGIVELDVAGTSMIPTLSPGDRVRVHLDRNRRRFGDVIVFGQGDSIVVHRFLGPASDRAGQPCLRSRGDGRRELDPPLAPENLIGTVSAVRRGGAWRNLVGTGGRAYGIALGLHDLFWAAAIHVAGRIGGASVAGAVSRMDRFFLGKTDALLFARLHPGVPVPPERGQEPR